MISLVLSQDAGRCELAKTIAVHLVVLRIMTIQLEFGVRTTQGHEEASPLFSHRLQEPSDFLSIFTTPSTTLPFLHSNVLNFLIKRTGTELKVSKIPACV
jgi:hypothetical protein